MSVLCCCSCTEADISDGMRNAYRSFARLYSELGRGMSVLTVDYRVAPEHPYPAALEDAITGYNWLLQAGLAGA